jgi:hypothetical protein
MPAFELIFVMYISPSWVSQKQNRQAIYIPRERESKVGRLHYIHTLSFFFLMNHISDLVPLEAAGQAMTCTDLPRVAAAHKKEEDPAGAADIGQGRRRRRHWPWP